MGTELVLSARAESFMPIMRLDEAKMRRNALVGFVRDMLTINHDFGNIPGTDKPTLLKPGAEKLVTFFGLTPVFVSERITENFGDDGAEPLFFYRYRCELYRDGTLLGTGIGSCNSRESKYRYRNADRVCPSCGKPAIIKGKADYGGGWLCFAKKGGCGAKFKAGDAAIEGQATGKVSNPDIADLVNTIDKMAQKRALIAATLIAVNASEFFTQDVEDMVIDAEYTVSHTNGGATQSPPVVVSQQPNDSIPADNHGTGNGTDHGAGNGNGGTNGKTQNEVFKRYADAKNEAWKTGKFSAVKHLDNAWALKFKEHKAGDIANADTFLAAWAEYVEAHVPEGEAVPA